jgi:hypothetical protein
MAGMVLEALRSANDKQLLTNGPDPHSKMYLIVAQELLAVERA